MKSLKHVSLTYLTYVCLLLGFVALGVFIYALAAQRLWPVSRALP